MDVVLVGGIAPGMENHSLAVLREALDAEGFSSAIVPFGGFAAIDRMVRAVLDQSPRICGVSVQTTESTLAALAFTRMLRAAGFAGQIVIGGHVATLMPDELLRAPAGIDVVIELAGERALVGLAQGTPARLLPGTHTREGKGLPAIPVRPRALHRRRLDEHLGFGTADVILSRGCAASCSYCCVSAVSSRAEQLGEPRHVARDIDLIADELADACALGARAFQLMDDNVLPLDPDAALSWVNSLRRALAARRVPRIALSLQLRADVVTPALADALVVLGVVRAYVGIDGYSAPHLRSLGRSAPASAGQRAIDLLVDRGIWCVANALIVGPTIRFETILAELEALSHVTRAPVHLLPIEARPGTVYHRRATSRGLIEGSPLWPVYRFEDPRAFLIGEVLLRLPTRLELRSVPIALYDLAWGLGVAQRLAPEVDVSPAAETYRSVTEAWNADQLRILRESCAAAETGSIDALIAREAAVVRAVDEALLAACDRALAEVERAISVLHRRPVRAHARGRLLGALALSLSLGAACSPGGRRVQPDAAIDAIDSRPDAVPCPDPARAPHDSPTDDACSCGNTSVNVTFDERGEVTGIAGVDGVPPPSEELVQCIQGLLAGYCYLSHAGTTAPFPTCHAWIA